IANTFVSADAIIAAIKPAITAAVTSQNQSTITTAILQTSLAALTSALNAIVPGIDGITAANLASVVQSMVTSFTPPVTATIALATAQALGQPVNLDALKPIIDAAVAKA